MSAIEAHVVKYDGGARVRFHTALRAAIGDVLHIKTSFDEWPDSARVDAVHPERDYLDVTLLSPMDLNAERIEVRLQEAGE